MKAKCTQSLLAGSISAAAPPSNHVSAVPFPTLSLNRCLPPAFSRKNLKPLVLLFCAFGFAVSGGPITKMPALSGEALSLYQNVAVNSSPNIPAVGYVK